MLNSITGHTNLDIISSAEILHTTAYVPNKQRFDANTDDALQRMVWH